MDNLAASYYNDKYSASVIFEKICLRLDYPINTGVEGYSNLQMLVTGFISVMSQLRVLPALWRPLRKLWEAPHFRRSVGDNCFR